MGQEDQRGSPPAWETALREGLPQRQQSWAGTWEVLPRDQFLVQSRRWDISPVPRVLRPSCSLGGGLKGSGRLCVSGVANSSNVTLGGLGPVGFHQVNKALSPRSCKEGRVAATLAWWSVYAMLHCGTSDRRGPGRRRAPGPSHLQCSLAQ